MPAHGHYTVSILVNGTALPEYEPDDSHGQSVDQVRYVEAAVGSSFSIETQVDRLASFPTTIKAFKVYMDGVDMGWRCIRSTDRKHGSYASGWRNFRDGCHFYVDGRWVKQKFHFSNLLTTEEKGDFDLHRRLAQSAGMIQVKIYDTTDRRVPVQASSWRRSIIGLTKVVSEKALKGRPIDMSAGLSEAAPTKPVRHASIVTSVGNCLASFVFLYRSRRSLQMLDVIPTTPEPESLEGQDPDSLSLEDARRLVSTYQARERNLATVKQEPRNVKDEKTPRKRIYIDVDDDECQIVSVKRAKSSDTRIKAEVEVLDLT